MIVDASAVLAVLFRETDAPRFAAAMVNRPGLRMSVANWFEVAMAVERRGGPNGKHAFEELMTTLSIEIMPLTQAHADQALVAWQVFGKGVHPASLNFGDCLAYGVAKVTGEPLLFKGNDFSQTDVKPALRD